jgi:hypothetical protein
MVADSRYLIIFFKEAFFLALTAGFLKPGKLLFFALPGSVHI